MFKGKTHGTERNNKNLNFEFAYFNFGKILEQARERERREKKEASRFKVEIKCDGISARVNDSNAYKIKCTHKMYNKYVAFVYLFKKKRRCFYFQKR